MKLTFAASLLYASFSLALLSLTPRQTSEFIYDCEGSTSKIDYVPPSDFRAFDLGSCTAQLTFTRDEYSGFTWNFQALYAVAPPTDHVPLRDFDNIGVSDTQFWGGENYFVPQYTLPLPHLRTNGTQFTAVHEFTDVCSDGEAPIAWIWYTTDGHEWCVPPGYSYRGPEVPVERGTRPPVVSGTTVRRIEPGNLENATVEITWGAVTAAVEYGLRVSWPCYTDEGTNPQYCAEGMRLQAPEVSTIYPTTGRPRLNGPELPRYALVHAVTAQGVWSQTNKARLVNEYS